jgi:hypothetical protein
MLNNSVSAKEYVMMTIPAFNVAGGIEGSRQERRIEQFEGLGRVETIVFTRNQEAGIGRAQDSPGLIQRFAWRWVISWRFMTDFLGIDRIRGNFKNILSG